MDTLLFDSDCGFDVFDVIAWSQTDISLHLAEVVNAFNKV